MKQLSDSFQIGNLTLKNRIAVPSMVCFDWTDDTGMVTDRNIAHYRALAQGGAGIIFSEAVCVTKRGRLHETQLGLWEDEQIEGWKRLAEVCHENNVPLLAQIHHAGINGIDDVADCPSDYTPAHPHHTPGKEMTLDRIVYIRNAFVKAALRCKAAGLDGVELHGCHGYLLSQFLSSKVNHRTDEYGEDRTPAYTTLDVSADYTFKIHNYTAVVQVGAENLTNAYYSTYADWGNIPRMGRNIFTSLKINF